MITLIGRQSMLLMWRSSINADNTLGMVFLYPLRIYHHPEMITLDVALFWDSKHARDEYSPYFTSAAKKTWTFTRIVTHDELVRKILKHRGMDPNLWLEDDDDNDDADEDYDMSSKSDDDNNPMMRKMTLALP
ncbi:hypothetical protein M9H77_34265 [Catharanthus roseus]|uniref:Uncharacterized protein n=1 Tax=Catharanthus roseus TaxID=4058 RepID=A0ACB9ZKZ3_CATRO|nr:hypothetical protein M9H77_34265 [Catharanthus roseus]